MGYTTEFSGEFQLDRELSQEHYEYLHQFSYTRRVKRHFAKAEALADPLREAVGLHIGIEGGYFVGTDKTNFGQGSDPSVDDYNRPPTGQHSLWCDWEPTEDKEAIHWNGSEKFYSYIEWLEYIIQHFLNRWGYTLNGRVTWQGEEIDDRGQIVVVDNAVSIIRGDLSGFQCWKCEATIDKETARKFKGLCKRCGGGDKVAEPNGRKVRP